ncbi:hypothetical protein H0H92_004663 [Tricholoma furcatifolium]|nr:hypothetical protein H0H92_004663 [Tricholoma furcatifolium]
MPKSAKKRRDKAADFTKAKLKLGKGKQLPSNAIDTSFKARSIALPSQSIANEKDDDTPTTKRKLSFDDLITHSKHYSASTRRDAILGLRELLEANWSLLRSSLTPLINACVRLIGDEDASVRKALLAFLAWLLPRIPEGDIAPHSSLLLLFTTSAQTHIFPEIRIDAIRYLNLFLEHIPQAVISGWNEDNNGHGSRVLEGYLGILNAGTKFGEAEGETSTLNKFYLLLTSQSGPMKATSTASVVLTPASKLIVLHSLSAFLQACLSNLNPPSATTSTDPLSSLSTWFLVPAFPRLGDYLSFEQQLRPSLSNTHAPRTWCEIADPEENEDDFPYAFMTTGDFLAGDNIQKLADVFSVFVSSDFDTSENRDADLISRLAQTLQSTLVATFLDCAPSVFTPSGSPSETQVQLVLAIGQIARALYGVILQASGSTKVDKRQVKADSTAVDNLSSLLGYMTPYFPFNSSGSRDVKIEQAFQDMNLIFCELTSLLVLATNGEVSRLTRRGKARQSNNLALPSKMKDSLPGQIQRISDYILRLLSGEASIGSQLGRALTPAAYVSLLPAIWALLNNTAGSTQYQAIASAVLNATIAHSIRTSSKSALKRLTIEFIARLILVCRFYFYGMTSLTFKQLSTDPRYQGHFRFENVLEDNAKIREWVAHLPQPLWEFGANNLPASEIILRFLIRALQRKSQAVHNSTAIIALVSKLIPYFTITHSVRGQLPGPYTKLPLTSPLRRLALDLAATLLLVISVDSIDGLCAAVSLAVVDTEEQGYWRQMQQMGVK